MINTITIDAIEDIKVVDVNAADNGGVSNSLTISIISDPSDSPIMNINSTTWICQRLVTVCYIPEEIWNNDKYDTFTATVSLTAGENPRSQELIFHKPSTLMTQNIYIKQIDLFEFEIGEQNIVQK